MRYLFLFALLLSPLTSTPQQKVVIEYWTMNLSPKYDSFFNNLEEKFEAVRPGVTVIRKDFSWEVIREAMERAIAAGNPPALVKLNVPWTYDYAEQGLLTPVEQYLKPHLFKYLEGSIKDLTFESKIYGFPFYNSTSVIIFNSNLLYKAGIRYAPRTLEEILNASIAVAQKLDIPGYAPMLGNMAGVFIQEDLPMIENGEAVFNSPEHVALVEKFKTAYQAGALLEENLFAEDNYQISIKAYNSGKLAMMVAPPSALKNTRSNRAVFRNTGVAPPPLNKKNVAPGGWLFHFAVPDGQDPEKMPLIADFGLFLTNAKNQLNFTKLSGTFPTSIEATQSDFFQKLSPNAGPFKKAIAIGAKNMRFIRTLYPRDDRKNTVILNQYFQSQIELAIKGKKPVKAALDDAVEYWNESIVLFHFNYKVMFRKVKLLFE